jgi:hypothetical protein
VVELGDRLSRIPPLTVLFENLLNRQDDLLLHVHTG